MRWNSPKIYVPKDLAINAASRYAPSMATPATPRRATVSVRLDSDTYVRVCARAREHGVTRATQIERYVLDGMDRDRYRDGDRISMVAGRRLQVRHVVEMVDGCDGDTAAAAAEYRLPIATVDACLAYYAEHQAEMVAWAEKESRAAERAYQLWLAEPERP